MFTVSRELAGLSSTGEKFEWPIQSSSSLRNSLNLQSTHIDIFILSDHAFSMTKAREREYK